MKDSGAKGGDQSNDGKSKKSKNKKRRGDDGLDLTSLSFYNLNNAGFFVNSVCFIGGYMMLCYVFYARPADASDEDRGFLDGMLVVLPIVFLLITNAIQEESNEMADVIVELLDEDGLGSPRARNSTIVARQEDNFGKISRLKFQDRLVKGGVILPLLAFVPLFLFSTNRQNSTRKRGFVRLYRCLLA